MTRSEFAEKLFSGIRKAREIGDDPSPAAAALRIYRAEVLNDPTLTLGFARSMIAIKDLPVLSNIDNLAEDKKAQILAFVHAVLPFETMQAAQSALRAFRTEAGTGRLETSRAANEIAATNAQKLDLYRCAED